MPSSEYRNFGQASLCSAAFLGIYIGVYSAQNLQSTIFETDGYGSLGYISNAVAYVGQGLGSVFCIYFQQRFGNINSMAYSSLLSLPFMLCLAVPALAHDNPSSLFLFSYPFVVFLTLFTSFFNGLGEGVA